MESDLFTYETWVEEALRKVIHRALEQTHAQGLKGDHHFFITFQTTFEGVNIPAPLLAEHPDEMTIVLQHQFHDLVVDEDGFAVTLSFNGRPSRLVIPYAAVTTFADPAVNFVLQLKMSADVTDFDKTSNGAAPQPAPVTDNTDIAETDLAPGDDDGAADDEKMGEVITLDAFRKK
ncbi:MAG: hypothetical protein HQ504_11805 [Rhodospirillaceae bacterium]|nr:hypothetical protein [Rhodospirillaceae bacterium]